MPELPEVETVRRGITPALVGRVLVEVHQRRADLRVPFPAGFAQRLRGRRVTGIDRRAKYILIALDDGGTLLVHLGMSGKFVIATGGARSAAAFGPHDHVVLDTDRGDRLIFNDPRRFGLMTLLEPGAAEESRWLSGLGPEPLGNLFSAASLTASLRNRRTSIKAALLDQSVVAGLGNIYVCEALFRSGISPRRSAHTVTGKRAERLAEAIKAVLQAAIASGGSSLRDYVQADGALGYFQHQFLVYGREGESCAGDGCSGHVERIVQAGRSTFFCKRCQR